MESNRCDFHLRPKGKPGDYLVTELKQLNEKLQESVDQLQAIEKGNISKNDILHDQEDKDRTIQGMEVQLKLTQERVNELEIQADELKRELKSQKQQLENLLQQQSCAGSMLSGCTCSSKENQTVTPHYINSHDDNDCVIPDFLDKDYREVLKNCLHFHINVMDKDIRTVLLDIRKSGQETVDVICKTFTLGNSSDFFLGLPRTRKQERRKRAATSKCDKHDSSSDFSIQLDKPLNEQYDFSIKPYLLYLSKKKKSGQEETDTVATKDEDLVLDYRLQQTPSPDSSDVTYRLVAQDRQFYQMWTGIVQGVCPINRKTAVKLAALLTQVYYGDKSPSNQLNDTDYSVKAFLPKVFWDHHISSEVDKEHCQLQGTHHSAQDHIAHVVETCTKLLTHDGIYYDVTIPKRSRVIGMIPRMRMKHCIFGISQYGVHKIDRKTGEFLFTHRFSDIYQTALGKNKNIFSLNFKSWDKDFVACSSQSEEICDIIQLFISMRERLEQVQLHFTDEKLESLSSSTKCSEVNSKHNPHVILSPTSTSTEDPAR